MNARDPFNLRNTSPALDLLRNGAATVQQRAVQASKRIASSVQQQTNTKIEDEPDTSSTASSEAHATAMSYALPQSEPVQRHHPSALNGHTNGGIGEKVSNMFSSDRKSSLPMYKDKPFQYPTSSKKLPWFRRRRTLAIVLTGLAGLSWWLGLFSRSSHPSTKKDSGDIVRSKGSPWLTGNMGSKVDWDARAEDVKHAFRLSWAGYEQNGWGFDEYRPVSKTSRQMTPEGLGWIIVDALDTMMLMNLTTELTHARQWLSNHTYDQQHDVNTFETTIRMLGGLLSAHYLSTQFDGAYAPVEDGLSEDLYVEKATDLADRLLGAYDSGSGLPYASVDLHKRVGIPSHADGGASSLAEATSLQLEMKYLAKVTGEEHYWKKAEKVMKIVDDNNPTDGLAPIFIYADQGTFRDDNIRLGSRGDSYYEYLIKQYLQTSQQEPVYQAMWNETLLGIKKHLITYSSPSNFTVLAERPTGLDGDISPKMDHLVCFMPGTLALATTGGLPLAQARKQSTWTSAQEEDITLAEELMKTCWGMYKVTPTGLAPEIAHFNLHDPPLMYNDFAPKQRPQSPAAFAPSNSPDNKGDYVGKQDYIIKPSDSHNLQRPETVESLFYMWRITGDVKYREWGWEMFQSFVEWTATEDGLGFSSVNDVTSVPPPSRDNMESFWLAETLKYFYLLFGKNDVLPVQDTVLNTEAHPFPRFELGKLFKTGWQRKPRDKDGKIIPEPAKPADEAAQGGLKTKTITRTREAVAATATLAEMPKPTDEAETATPVATAPVVLEATHVAR